MGKASRDKGARAELEAAEMLRAWWDPHEPGVVFKRTPSSGGWADKDARGAFSTAGDLVTSSRTFPFCVEVKRREGWSWNTLLAGKASPVWSWWLQAIEQASEQPGSHPLLMFRKSRQPWSVMVPGNVAYFGPSRLMLTKLVVSFPPGARARWGAVEPVAMSAQLFLSGTPEEWRDGARGATEFGEGHNVENGAEDEQAGP